MNNLVFSLLLLLAVKAEEKVWLGYLDWQDPANWLNGIVPFSSGSADSEEALDVVFPSEMRHALGMPPRLDHLERIARLELTRDGVLALPEDAKVAFVSSAPTIRAQWLRDTAYHWLDPNNWATASSKGHVNSAVPHLERLPCQTDLVVLPPSSRVFSLRLPRSRVVEVSEIRLADDNESLASWEWRALAREHLNSFDALEPYSLTVKYSPFSSLNTQYRCQEGELADYLEEICAFERPRSCQNRLLECERPLKVEGHCCPYCGGRVLIGSQGSLLSRVKRLAGEILEGFAVDWHARLTWDANHVEVLVREKGGGYEGVETLLAVEELSRELKSQVLGSETSGDPLFEHGFLSQIALPLLAALALAVTALTLVCYGSGYSAHEIWSGCSELLGAMLTDFRSHKREERNKKRFAFAKYENLSEGESVNLGDVCSDAGERFENPLYGSRRSSSSASSFLQHQESPRCLNQPVSLKALQKDIELDQI